MFTRYLSKFICTLLLACTLSACSRIVQNQEADHNSNHQAAKELLAQWDSETAPGVSVAVMLDDEVVLSSGHGLANLEHAIPITPETVLHSASISKQFTAFAIFLLASENKLDLDADIRNYIPELQAREHSITIRHLLNHTGGLREVFTLSMMAGWLEEDIHTNQQYMNLLTRQTSENFKPGEHVEYSNSGYFLLARIVERVSQQSFHDFTQERIFIPLGMTNTQFRVDRGAVLKNKASSYAQTNNGFRHYHLISETVGASGLDTSALDLLKWAQNFTTQKVGSPDVFKLMAERSFAADNEQSIFANGQELRPYKGFQTWSHGGTMAGFRSFLLRVPETKFAVSILSNRSDFDTAKLAFELSDIFLNEHEKYTETSAPAWSSVSSDQLQSYAGEYELFPGTIISITTDGTSLYLSFNGSEKSALPQIGEHQFDLNPNNNLFIEFDFNDEGISDVLKYTIGIHGSIKAKRFELKPFDSQSVDLSEYIGRYFSDELQTQYEIVVEDGQLLAKHIRLPSAVLTPYQDDTFFGQGGMQEIIFLRASSGDVVGLLGSGPLAEDVKFNKR